MLGRAGTILLVAGTVARADMRPTPQPSPLTVVVNCAPFEGVEQAAVAESAVRWNDRDLADDDACTESYAAVELRDLLRRCSLIGAREIALSAADSLPTSGDVIVLGNPGTQPLVRRLLAGALPDPRSRDAFRIRALRRGARTIWVIAGTSRTGTLYGTYAFLERLGVRFYGPSDSETVWPRDPVSLPARIDLASSPGFGVRGFWAWEPRGNAAFFRWMARRRMNLWSAAEPGVPLLRKLGIQLAGGGHSLQTDYLNPRAPSGDGRHSNFEAHPDWYGLRGGQRSANISGETGDNFCTSNSTAVAELGRNLTRSLGAGPLANADLVNVWPLDGGHWCECDACRAIGEPSDRAVALARQVNDAVRQARRRGELDREILLSAAAYLETMAPPVRPVEVDANDRTLMVTFFPYHRCYAHPLSDPSCTEINRRIESAWNGWSRDPTRAYRGSVGMCEYYNVSWFKTLPLVFPHVMARDIRDAHAAGARLFIYMHVPTARWGTWRLDHLILSEGLWNPGLNADSLVADYCARAYPGASADMRAFHAALETASANILAIEHAIGAFGASGAPQGRLGVPRWTLFPLTHLQLTPTARDANAAPSWSEIVAAMRAARRSIDHARLVARAPAERARIDDDAERFRYGELTFELYDRLFQLARADRREPGVEVGQALSEADSLAAALQAIHDLVQVSGAHANAADGLEASHVAPALGYFRKHFGPGAAPH